MSSAHPDAGALQHQVQQLVVVLAVDDLVGRVLQLQSQGAQVVGNHPVILPRLEEVPTE